jgi:hypothetical protein
MEIGDNLKNVKNNGPDRFYNSDLTGQSRKSHKLIIISIFILIITASLIFFFVINNRDQISDIKIETQQKEKEDLRRSCGIIAGDDFSSVFSGEPNSNSESILACMSENMKKCQESNIVFEGKYIVTMDTMPRESRCAVKLSMDIALGQNKFKTIECLFGNDFIIQYYDKFSEENKAWNLPILLYETVRLIPEAKEKNDVVTFFNVDGEEVQFDCTFS